MLHDPHRQLCARVKLELGQDVLHVHAHRPFGDHQFGRNLPTVQTAADEAGHLQLASGEARRADASRLRSRGLPLCDRSRGREGLVNDANQAFVRRRTSTDRQLLGS